MISFPQIDADFIEKNTDCKELINSLHKYFCDKNILVPQRQHHNFPNPDAEEQTTLLFMPAWNPGRNAGVKFVTISPENQKHDLPAIQGIYFYMDASTGVINAVIDAKTLTAKRTAAASALASSYLSQKQSSRLLMIGTGSLSKNLILAHASVRPITEVYIWGRNPEKAAKIAEELSGQPFAIRAVAHIEQTISQCDIISCATLSKYPLIQGKWLKKGQHVDLVGSYKPDMREADDDVMKVSRIFLDSRQSGLRESGDIVIPLQSGLISEPDICADLFELCSGEKKGRLLDEEITVFKSAGHALEDLAAAEYYFNQFSKQD